MLVTIHNPNVAKKLRELGFEEKEHNQFEVYRENGLCYIAACPSSPSFWREHFLGDVGEAWLNEKPRYTIGEPLKNSFFSEKGLRNDGTPE